VFCICVLLLFPVIQGAKSGGAEGFFKGVGKGLLGVVAKPASGAVGFASQTLQGIGNTPEFLSDSKLHPRKVRPQRYISPDTGAVEPFNYARAERWEADQKLRIKTQRKGKQSDSRKTPTGAASARPSPASAMSSRR